MGAEPLVIADAWAGQPVYPIGTRIHVELWRDTPLAVCNELRKVPGARWIRKNWKLDLPIHAWCMLAYQHVDPLIRALVPQLPVLRVVVPPGPPPPADPLAALYESEFYDELLEPGSDQFNSYQRRGLHFAGRRNGGHIFWSPGAGKTRLSFAWGLLPPVTAHDPAGLLVVTPASVRIQWGAEAVGCGDVIPWVSDPTLAARKTWRSPAQYLLDMRCQGRRPIFIVGWEELARLYYGDEAHEGRAGQRRSARTRLRRHWAPCEKCGADEGDPCVNARSKARKPIKKIHDGRVALWETREPIESPVDLSGRHGFLKPLIESGVITSVVWDEAQEGKSHQRFRWVRAPGADPDAKFVRKDRVSRGNRAAAAQEIAEHLSRCLTTTGTPASKDVLDFHGILTLVESDTTDQQKNTWGTYKQFALYHCGAKPTTYGVELPEKLVLHKDSTGEDAMDLIEETELTSLRFRMGVVPEGQGSPPWATVHVVRESESHRHLPPKRRRVCYVPSNELAKVNAVDLERCLKAQTMSTTGELVLPRGQQALVAMTALMKTPYVARRAVERLTKGHKVCIITSQQLHVERLVEAISELLPTTTIWGLHGSNSSNKERDDIRLEYLAAERGGHGMCVVGTGATIGVGLNWQGTDLGILAMVPTTPKQLIQYENRWFRLGLTHSVDVLIPVALGTIDRRAVSVLRGRLVEAGEALLDVSMCAAADSLLGTDSPEELADMLRATMEEIGEREGRVADILNEALLAVEDEELWL